VAYRVTGPARTQIVEVLAKSAADYGERGETNYQALLEAAMEDVGANPQRPGARSVERIKGVWCYDIRYSRNRLARERRVRDPWHVLVYCQDDDGVVAILAVVGRSYPPARAARQAIRNR
jgi:toxin ParE1/3/4